MCLTANVLVHVSKLNESIVMFIKTCDTLLWKSEVDEKMKKRLDTNLGKSERKLKRNLKVRADQYFELIIRRQIR